MYKNQLQELAQRSCFNLPSYSCIREGPDHAPRFKAKVNFNGEIFESLNFFSTLRQAEHASAEVALKTLSQRGPSRALAARVLEETGVYKNLLQETAHRAGLNLPVYTTIRSGGPGCAPHFTCTVELAGMSFRGEPAKTKKQAQKGAAMAAWFSLKNLSQQDSSGCTSSDEQEQITVPRYLARFKLPERRKPLKAHFKNDMIPYNASRSNYTYIPLLPDVATYQNWHQNYAYFPYTPPSISRPQFFPFVQSIFQSGFGPFFYMAGDLIPACTSNSQVRIEEIEENSQIEEEAQTCNHEEFSWLPPGFLRNDLGAIAMDQTTLHQHNGNYSSFLPSQVQATRNWRSNSPQSTRGKVVISPETSQRNRIPTFAVPRTADFAPRSSRSTVLPYSTIPWLERSRIPCARAIAPAVQIRSVVPVCSARGQRVPPLSHEAVQTKEKETSNDVSAASSEFSRLQM